MIPEKPPLRYNNVWLGLALGLVFPLVCFFIYRMIVHPTLGFPQNLIRYLMIMESLSDIMMLCTVGNLLVFYIALKRPQMAKGIIYGTLVYVALIFYIKFFIETNS